MTFTCHHIWLQNQRKWHGGVFCPEDRCIYAIPCNAESVPGCIGWMVMGSSSMAISGGKQVTM
jgi:hypothetical protein